MGVYSWQTSAGSSHMRLHRRHRIIAAMPTCLHRDAPCWVLEVRTRRNGSPSKRSAPCKGTHPLPCIWDATLLSSDDVAALRNLNSTAVRKAIREGRLPACSVPFPPSKKHPNGGGRFAWRVRAEDAVAWEPERYRRPSEPIPDGTIEIREGPKEPGELSVVEAAGTKGVSWKSVYYAIEHGKLLARWSPEKSRMEFPVPRPGPSSGGRWYVRRSDIEAWKTNAPRRMEGVRPAGPPGKREDELTVSEVAALKGVRTATIRTAIWAERLPARWVPRDAREEGVEEKVAEAVRTVTRPRRKGSSGWWLIRREDAEAYRPLTPEEVRAKGRQAYQEARTKRSLGQTGTG